jgi:uncharacterized SAM-binding protein YcdF (DUF218 family)
MKDTSTQGQQIPASPAIKLAAWLLLIGVVFVAWVAHIYHTIPLRDTGQNRFDAIVVLGSPSLPDGSLSPEQRSRVLEGVSEYGRHVAPRIILTGGAAHNSIVEAHTMAVFAQSLGVPSDAVIEEAQAHNTIENVFYTMAILRQHGWNSAEFVTSPDHVQRTALIVSRWPLVWRTHPADWPPEYSAPRRTGSYALEALECWRLRTFGFIANRLLPDGSALLPGRH